MPHNIRMIPKPQPIVGNHETTLALIFRNEEDAAKWSEEAGSKGSLWSGCGKIDCRAMTLDTWHALPALLEIQDLARKQMGWPEATVVFIESTKSRNQKP